MASLNQYAQQLADSLNRPYDEVLKERIKDLIVQERATFLQRTMDKDGIDKEYRQTYYADLVLVNVKEITGTISEGVEGQVYIYKSINRIPKPIRWKNYTPFFYVGREDGRLGYRATNYYSASLNKFLPLIGNIIGYDYIDGYIYIFPQYTTNNVMIPVVSPVRIDEVIQNLRFVRTNNHKETRENCIMYTDDMEFPIPMDMINPLKLNLKELFITDHKDVIEKTHLDTN